MKITSGDAELVLAPEMGGAVVSWTIAGRPIFRPANPDATDARQHSCYPLVPFSNRVGHRRFTFDGQTYELPATLGQWAIHGAGWQCAWTLDGTAMKLAYPGGALWPFAFDAVQEFDLSPTTLAVTMRMTNRHSAPVPAALGLHPFYPRNDATLLQLHAGSVWQAGADKIPVKNTPVPPEWDFAAERALGEADIDNCFAGWDGRYVLTWPDRRERLVVQATPPLRHLVIYVPHGQPFTAIEPVSNMNDGLNHMNPGEDHGIAILQPGESLEGRIVMTVEELT